MGNNFVLYLPRRNLPQNFYDPTVPFGSAWAIKPSPAQVGTVDEVSMSTARPSASVSHTKSTLSLSRGRFSVLSLALLAFGSLFASAQFAEAQSPAYNVFGGTTPAVPGNVYRLVGNGTATSSGDGGSAISAGLNQPTGVAFDSHGNLYIVEFIGQRVRMVTPQGIISTVAGNGTRGFSGDGGVVPRNQFAE